MTRRYDNKIMTDDSMNFSDARTQLNDDSDYVDVMTRRQTSGDIIHAGPGPGRRPEVMRDKLENHSKRL